jgi:hypothetical protein
MAQGYFGDSGGVKLSLKKSLPQGYRTLDRVPTRTMRAVDVEVEYSLFVGVTVAVIETLPRTVGFQLHVATLLGAFPDVTRELHVAILLLFAKNRTTPVTGIVTEIDALTPL